MDAQPGMTRRRGSKLALDPRSTRQLSERGPIAFWRNGGARREGLVCLVDACGNPACDCRDVHLSGILVDDRATAVSGGTSSVRVTWPAGVEPQQSRGWPLRITIDLDTNVIEPRGNDVRSDLVDWLRAELDRVLVDLLHRRWQLAKR